VWDNEPVQSGELAKLCADKLGWKRTTTYTVLKKLVSRGILRNENAVVTSLVSKDDVLRYESRAVTDRAFGGSLPTFVAAFLDGRTLTEQEAESIMRMIDKHREGSK
jgi:predicted transcriptional regulator